MCKLHRRSLCQFLDSSHSLWYTSHWSCYQKLPQGIASPWLSWSISGSFSVHLLPGLGRGFLPKGSVSGRCLLLGWEFSPQWPDNPCGVPPALPCCSSCPDLAPLMSSLWMSHRHAVLWGSNTVLFSRKSFQQMPQVYNIFINSPFTSLLSWQLCGR